MGEPRVDNQTHVDILIGNDVPLYRELLTATLLILRPQLLVQSVLPEELDYMACRLRPVMVICSAPTAAVVACASTWVVLHPNDRDEAIISTARSTRTIPHATVSALLSVFDDIRP